MSYTTVFLDADGTLLDFAGAQRAAFYTALGEFGVQADDELVGEYDRINRSLWERLEQGTVRREEIFTERFAQLFSAHAIALDPFEVNPRYLLALSQNCGLMRGAEEMLARLSGHCKLAIVTNGVAESQRRRLSAANIMRYFSHLCISEEIGFEKPDPRFFQKAIKLCGVTDPDSVLVVGDSLSADIAGGAAFGLATCWFNPKHLALSGAARPDYVIDDLEQLPGIVLK